MLAMDMVLDNSYARLTQAGLNLIQQALSIFDSDLRLAVCNRQYQLMFDLPDALTRTGTSFEDTIRYLVVRGEYGELDDIDEAVTVRVDQARAFEAHYIERLRANGRWISVEGAPLSQGGWVTIYTDITEHKAQEALLRARSEELSEQVFENAERLASANRALAATNAALEEAKRELIAIEARTRQVTEMMPAHIAHVDHDLRYTFSNHRLSTVMPGSANNIVGLPMSEALSAETFARIQPSFERALAGTAQVFEINHEPSARRIRIALTPDKDSRGVYVLSTDVTGEAQARAALQQGAKRALAAQLTSGLAHDFANLLTIMLGLQGRLERLEGLPEEARPLVASTLGAARRGGMLLDRIARISGPRELQPQPVDLPQLLADLVAMARPSLGDAVTVTLQTEGVDQPLMLDPGTVQDSLLNLMLNARDAMGEVGGQITIHACALRETWVEISVSDTGGGFSEMALKRGLDPFFSTKGSEGSGLGLSMVYDQVKLSGGTVQLANTEAGAVVVLRLPLRLATGNANPMLVLLVEDSDTIRAETRERLRQMGHSVIETASAEEALQLLDLPELGFVLSDINLSGPLNGVDLAQSLRESHPMLGVALVTSLPPYDQLRMEAPCPVIQKPVSDAALAAILIAGGAR